MPRLTVCLAVLVIAQGCGARTDLLGLDTPADAGPCRFGPTEAFELDPGGVGAQRNADVVFDGGRVHVVFDGDGELRWTSIGCAGPAPTRALGTGVAADRGLPLADPVPNGPQITAGAGGLLVAWSSGDAIHTRRFERTSGEWAPARSFAITVAGAPTSAQFVADALALPDGTFVLSGVGRVAEAQRLFVQPLGSSGDPSGPAAMPSRPSLDARDSGGAVAWTPDGVVVTWNVPGWGVPRPLTALASDPARAWVDAGGTDVASDRSDPNRLYLLEGGRLAVVEDWRVTSVVTLLDRPLGPGERVVSARLATAPEGGAAVLARTGVDSERLSILYARTFELDGTRIMLGPEVELDPVGPVGFAVVGSVAVTHVEGDLYFVAWSEDAERSAPHRMRGRLIRRCAVTARHGPPTPSQTAAPSQAPSA